MSSKCTKQQGFTLIELLITIAIAAMVLSFAVPAVKTMIRNNQLTAATNDLISTLHYARSEAIRRGLPVAVCSSSNNATCSADTDWSTGWITWVDADNNNTLDGGEDVTFMMSNDSQSLNLLNSTGQSSLRYLPSGYLSIAPGTPIAFHVCDDRTAETGRLINISPTGSPRVRNAPCG